MATTKHLLNLFSTHPPLIPQAITNANNGRESSLRTKRLRRDPSMPALGLSRPPSAGSLPEAPSPEPKPSPSTPLPLPTPLDIAQHVQSAIQALKSTQLGSSPHLTATRTLRTLLSCYDDPPTLQVLSSGGIPLLIAALQPPKGDAISQETTLEAAWAITNLAVGEPPVVAALLPAAPLLIAHVDGGSSDGSNGSGNINTLSVAEQCAWALGNIAGEDLEYRSLLVANGAVPPLTRLLITGVDVSVSASSSKENGGGGGGEADASWLLVSAGATAAWALANLLRRTHREVQVQEEDEGVSRGSGGVGAFMATAQAPEALVTAMQKAPDVLCNETSWILAYVTAPPHTQGEEEASYINRMVELGIVAPLCRQLQSRVEQILALYARARGSNREGEDDVEELCRTLVPVLRSLGNIAAGGPSAAVAQLISEEAQPAIQAVVVCAESRHHGLQRESAWVLGNLAAAPGVGHRGIDCVRKANGIPALMSLLKHGPFDVRKEAAFALANVCAGGDGGVGGGADSEAMNYLFGADLEAVKAMVSLMRSVDMEAAKLGLQFTEMMCRLLPATGPQQVELAEGVDAIEALQYGGGTPEELRGAAALLVDRYWGERGG